MADQGKTLGADREPQSSGASQRLEVAIQKGHVRRAIGAADTVYAAAKGGPTNESEDGVVLMTAVLLVERLATAAGCEPLAVLNKIADCFALKREYAKLLRRGSPS